MNTRLVILTGAFIVAVAVLSGCSGPHAGTAEPSESATEVTPVSYPVPDGCPTGDQFGTAYVGDGDWAEEIDYELLAPFLSTALPGGGCGYLVEDGGTTESGSSYERIIVFYFNIDTPGRPSHSALHNWGVSAGGTPGINDSGETSKTSLELPADFSTFTNASFGWVDGETSYWFLDDETIPAFTQGASAKVEFFLPADAVATAKSAAQNGVNSSDPSQALAAGIPSVSSVDFSAVDPDGYTADYSVTARLQPFTTDVTNSAPGELEILSSASFSAAIKNTTPQRNTQTATVGAFALYPKGSAACTRYNGVSIKDADWQDSSYCMISLGRVGSAELVPGGSQSLETGDVSINHGPFPEGGPELTVFNSPLAMYASLDPISMMTTTDWTSDKGCLTNLGTTSAWVIAMNGWPDPVCLP